MNISWMDSSLGQGIEVVPQVDQDSIILIHGKGGKCGILCTYAFENHTVPVALDEQRFPGDEVQDLIFLQRNYEVLEFRPMFEVE